ncbi:MAG: GtrA family protein [Thaumarchaeota archaeon]|nr:GtrA family protein [Nitrososphaerota archaeon]
MSIRRKLFSRQFIIKGLKFASIGALGTVLNLAILYTLTDYGHIYYIFSELVAIVIVFVFNYVGNIAVGNIKIESEGATQTREPAAHD